MKYSLEQIEKAFKSTYHSDSSWNFFRQNLEKTQTLKEATKRSRIFKRAYEHLTDLNYVEYNPDTQQVFFVLNNGEKVLKEGYNLQRCIKYVKGGAWKEIT